MSTDYTTIASLNDLALFFFPALLLSLWLTPCTIRIAHRLKAIDYPGGRKEHQTAVSRLGGLALTAGLFGTYLLSGSVSRASVAFFSGAILVVLIGFLDDVYHIAPATKFVGELASAAVFVAVSGASVSELGNLFGTGTVHLGKVASVFTAIGMVGVINALNLSDGLDGLAGGISAIACVYLATFAFICRDWFTLHILVGLLGALFGFLRYNTHPANLFMGDTGSLLLGYSLSVVAVRLTQNSGVAGGWAPVTVAAVLALPITDTLLVMARRIWHGENPFRPDRTHLHHRLLALGFPHALVVSILYVSMGMFGLQAWLLHESPEWVQFLAVLLLGTVINGVVFVLQRSGYGWRMGDVSIRGTSSPSNSRLTQVIGRSTRGVSWAIGIGLAFPILTAQAIPPLVTGMAMAVLGFVGVLFPWRSRGSSVSVSYGLLYLACLCLLALLQIIPTVQAWVPGYHAVLSALVFTWVLLKLKYCGHRDILQISSFEMLLLSIAFFIPLVLLPSLGYESGLRRMLLAVCLESVAFLLALKILIRRQPRRNFVIVTGLLVALGLIVAKGLSQPNLSIRLTDLSGKDGESRIEPFVHWETARLPEKLAIDPSLSFRGTD